VGQAVPDAARDRLLGIGAFARRSRLSLKALRLYDRSGLLVPADVNPATGYRRYRESQLLRARQIVMMRRAGIPLAQVAELKRWLPEALTRLTNAAREYGGPWGALFAVYHGEVNEDSDGPVEVCVPIPCAATPPPDLPVRPDPAHREVYLTITRAQLEFPQILSAFDSCPPSTRSRPGSAQQAWPRLGRHARSTSMAST
jgi:DNA-binding transcriptional MerR regulator